MIPLSERAIYDMEKRGENGAKANRPGRQLYATDPPTRRVFSGGGKNLSGFGGRIPPDSGEVRHAAIDLNVEG